MPAVPDLECDLILNTILSNVMGKEGLLKVEAFTG